MIKSLPLRPVLVSAALASLSIFSAGGAFADTCREIFQAKDRLLTTLSYDNLMFLSWEGGEWMQCRKIHDMKHQCGDRVFVGGYAKLVDKNGNEWPYLHTMKAISHSSDCVELSPESFKSVFEAVTAYSVQPYNFKLKRVQYEYIRSPMPAF